MKRKLLALNLVLVALIALAGWGLRLEWIAAKEREKAVLGRTIKPAPAPEHVPLPNVQPVLPARYIDIANKDLFSKERNPTIVVEPEAPPPPKPMPPLPVVRGILNLDGVTAIMSENPKAMQKEVRPGDSIGEFKLLAINSQEIVLEWDGKQLRKNVAELFDRSIPEPAAAPAAASAAAPAPAVNKPSLAQKTGPGVDMGAGRKACVPGDTTPVGTVVDGLKKVTWETPFGTGCAWEPPKSGQIDEHEKTSHHRPMPPAGAGRIACRRAEDAGKRAEADRRQT